MILVIDNYDSFVFNLARYLRELGRQTEVVRNDALSVADALALEPEAIVLSPGPCGPAAAGISVALARAAIGARVPLLGVCLGHQCLTVAAGGTVCRAPRPVHGRASKIRHTGTGLFKGLPAPLTVARYHSLMAHLPLPAALEAQAWLVDDGLADSEEVVMAMRHRAAPAWGVQFHPESVLTEHGHALLENFLALAAARPAPPHEAAPASPAARRPAAARTPVAGQRP